MNKIYRIIWSEVRQAFSVTQENAATRGKPASSCKGVASAVSAALLAISATPAMAVDCDELGGTQIVSGLLTDQCNLVDGESLVVEQGGQIRLDSGGGGTDIYGVRVNNKNIGSISNSGTISASNASGANVVGISVFLGRLTGGIINNADAIITATGNTSASAIELRGTRDIGGDISNSGTISASTTGATGTARGIYLPAGTVGGNIINDGAGAIITATGSSASAIELESSSVAGNISNAAGTISASATGGSGSARGIYLKGSTIRGAIDNSGTITATGVDSASGIELNSVSSVTGNINNSGTISASTTGTTGTARGIYLPSGTVGGNIINDGAGAIITATGSSARAIELESSSVVGNISNAAGTISASATGGSGSARGIYLRRSTVGGDIDNSGTITATGVDSAYGIWLSLFSNVTGSISNTGTISASATGATGTARAVFMRDSGVANINNAAGGLITATSDNGDASAVELLPGSGTRAITGNISNNGMISASGAGTVRGIYLRESTATNIINLADGTISATASAGEASAIQLSNEASVSGNITNAGNISASTTGATGTARGIYVNASTITGGIDTGRIDNSGTITATGVDSASGIELTADSSVTGDISNTGTISASVTGTDTASTARAVFVQESTVADINNADDGVILAISDNGDASAVELLGTSMTVNAGNISNSGMISASGAETVRGIYLWNATAASITNDANDANDATGTISATSSGGDASGIQLASEALTSGNISNSGTISASVSGGTGTARAVFLQDSTAADINNAAGGLISATSDNGDASAVELLTNGSSTRATAGNISNSGMISASGALTVRGIYLRNATVANIANDATGTISATSSGGDASGIQLASEALTSGNISNAGTISANVTGGSGSARGIYLNYTTITGGIDNSGTITATGVDSAYGIGLSTFSSVTGNISNSGTISAYANGTASSSTARAVSVQDSTVADINNAAGGLITATSDNGDASAVELSPGSYPATVGNISNSGTISARGADTVRGIYLRDSTAANITNDATGTISATASAGESSAIQLSDWASMSGNITNAGTITATGSLARGIYLINSTITGGIDNGGTISALGVDSASGIELTADSSVTGNISNTGTISASVTGTDTASTARAVFVQESTAADINNAAGGVISAISDNGDASAVELLTGLGGTRATAGTISNSGMISASGAGTVRGIYLWNATAASITNDATGTISASSSGGSASAIEVAANSIVNSIVNNGTIDGAVLANGTVNNGISNSGTINGALTLAANTLNLDGNTSQVNGVVSGNVNSQVNVNGVFTTGNTFDVGGFNIASGAQLNMGHNVTVSDGGFNNDGTLSVASNNTATIDGNYTQGADGIFRTHVDSDTSYGRLSVTGTATLGTNANINVDVSDANFSFTTDTLNDVISAGTLNSDGSFNVSDNSYLFDFAAVKDGNNVDLTLERNGNSIVDIVAPRPEPEPLPDVTPGTDQVSVPVIAEAPSPNPPSLPAARALDQILTDVNNLVSREFIPVSAGTQKQIADAVIETLPMMTGGMKVAAKSLMSGINRVVQIRSATPRGLSGLSSGDVFYGDEKYWLKTFGAWAEQDDRDNVTGYKADGGGLVIGADAMISEQTRLGVAFAYGRMSVDSESSVAPNSVDVDSYQINTYGNHALDADTEVNFRVGVGRNNNRGERRLNSFGSTAKVDYSSLVATLGGGVSRVYDITEQTSLVPSVRFDYNWIKEDSYTETGAGALSLSVDEEKTDELILSVDGKLTHEFSDGAAFMANLGVGYDVLNERSSTTASYVGAPGVAFTTPGIDPSPWLVQGGLGLVKKADNGLEFSVRYDAEYRRDYLGQSASVNLRWSF